MDDNDDKGDTNMNLKLKIFLKGSVILISLLQMVACGSGRQNVTGIGNPGVAGAPGTLDQKVRSVLNTFRCNSGSQHVLTVLRFNSVYPASVGTRINTVALNESGAKQVAVGITQERNVVVVKDYGHALDAYFYMCPTNNWTGVNNGTIPVNNLFVQSGTIETEFQTTAMNPRCTFTQIAMFNVTLHISGGVPIPFAFFPVDYLGSVPLVCEAGGTNNSFGPGYNNPYNNPYGNGNNYGNGYY